MIRTMKNLWRSNLISLLLIGFAVLIISSVDYATSPTIAGRTPSLETRVAKSNASGVQRTPRKKRPLRKPDVIYYPTPPETVAEMLRMVGIKKGDVLYDLGSGDGRIPIAAAAQYGIRAVGI